jgi:hypothetical protein
VGTPLEPTVMEAAAPSSKRPRTEPATTSAGDNVPSTAWSWAPHEPAVGASSAEVKTEFTLSMSTGGAPPGANEWEHKLGGSGSVAPIELPAMALSGSFTLHSLCMRDQGLTSASLPASMWGLTRLLSLDLSRNRLELLPPGVGGLIALQTLDISRNRLKELPKELGGLQALVTLSAQSNHLRPAKRSLPLAELGKLLHLRSIDLRFNQKLKAAAGLLAESVPQAKALLAGPPPTGAAGGKKETAADRDATLLRSQLEPLSTPTLRRRLAQTFGTPTDPESVDRAQVMTMLLDCYAKEGPSGRVVRPVACSLLAPRLQEALLAELRGVDWASTMRERLSVRAEGYLTLQRPPVLAPGEAPPQTKAAKLAAAKLTVFQNLWDLAAQAIESVDADYAQSYSAIAVSKCFVGSPHIDTYDVGPQYALSLGDFTGGALMVESGPREVCRVDTHDRMTKVDGRFPHWVDVYEGERFSAIWFRTKGEPTPQTTAVFGA